MSISVNDVEITDDAVERELPFHESSPSPVKSAVEALVLREVLLQAARDKVAMAQEELRALEEAGGEADRESLLEDALINRLIEMEVSSPTPTMEECEIYYRKNLKQFRNGDLVEASHILFQVTPNVPLDALRAKAEEVLQQVQASPAQFGELARTYSNCTSAEVGGNLGQLSKGQTVPEFERVIFSLESGEIAPKLVESRFGLHIVRVEHRVEGHTLPFEMVREKLAQFLAEQVRTRALKQYLKILVGQANIQGVEMEGADSPLLQ
ncbi:MAG: peptidylprolyl isomerase [Gallionellaceae bacterium]|jgi:peptidyl-prolyl cis-trans isomerase C